MRLLFYLFLAGFFLTAQAQEFTTDDYYLFPIDPGQQNFLAGTMGELRASHFHAGIDIKTGGRTGLPVHAAADGYISRIKVGTNGYGQALYMTHPNGTTTLYGHLEAFQDEIAEYVREKQYNAESFDIELFPPSYMFPFHKGDVIAYSGNTGSSSGPHLHFEIRDKNQNIMDPLKFGFNEIKDNVSPQIRKIAFVTLDGDARVNNTFGRFEFDVLQAGGVYKTRVPITLYGNVGVEIYAYDLLNGVMNQNGIPISTLVIDNDTVFMENKSRLAFAQQREILVHMDYDGYLKNGIKYNKLFVDDGNELNIYKPASHGYFFKKGPHTIKIFSKDSYGNIATLETEVNVRDVINPPDPTIRQFEIYRNYMHFKAPHTGNPPAIKLYLGKATQEITPYRTDLRQAYYLWDLREGLPDSVDFCGKIIPTHLYSAIPSNAETSFYNHDIDVFVTKKDLFDTLYLQFEKDYDAANAQEIFRFFNDDPLRSNIRITLIPDYSYPEKARVYTKYGSRLSYVGGTWKNGEITFSTRNFGTFTIAEDAVAPVIVPKVVTSQSIQFKIYDSMSGIKSYRATLNGEFLLMKYEYKENLIWAEPLQKGTGMKGELILEVEDNTGNVAQYTRKI